MTECAVRHLRVAAASEPAARRFVTTLEDALRCATLPGGDRRVVAVRRLALGRVPHDAGTQALGRLVEERLARGDIAWATPDEPPHPHADIIGFAAPLEARVHLARRLAAGVPCDAWYWPQAVPEYRRDLAPREALRRIAQALATLAEARVALPAWVARVVLAGGAGALRTAIDEPFGQALLRAAGIAIPAALQPAAAARRRAVADAQAAEAGTQPGVQPGAAPRPVAPGHAAAADSPDDGPLWLRVALERAGVASPGTRSTSATATATAIATTHAPAPASASRTPASPARPSREIATPVIIAPNTSHAPVADAPHSPDSPAARPATPAATSPLRQRDTAREAYAAAAGAATLDGDWRPTDCGGLLFLLPVLARCGLVAHADPDAARIDALRVLQRALHRLRAPPHDPAWDIVADLSPLPPAAARDAHARAGRELGAARLWLQRHARVGLVTLVRRRAALALTATHIDVRFPLAGANVRLRRLGLDADPGWVPWFGRVIAFQFAGRLP